MKFVDPIQTSFHNKKVTARDSLSNIRAIVPYLSELSTMANHRRAVAKLMLRLNMDVSNELHYIEFGRGYIFFREYTLPNKVV